MKGSTRLHYWFIIPWMDTLLAQLVRANHTREKLEIRVGVFGDDKVVVLLLNLHVALHLALLCPQRLGVETLKDRYISLEKHITARRRHKMVQKRDYLWHADLPQATLLTGHPVQYVVGRSNLILLWGFL